ncbi:head GIN domain-containing protein [Sunxiuqinia sp. sy24]|uniref:head GIN domain-containing protein n=1 Tax=Sunxiuqinia sp. sy24 TaxID=3461495 RepID=UPI0040461313
MKTKLISLITIFSLCIGLTAKADEETRELPSFSEISVKIPATVYVEHGEEQSVEVVAKSSTLEEIITEVKGRELIIRFAAKNYIFKSFTPGKIEVYITVPEINALSLSGSGKIINDGSIASRILDLSVSGSGDILLDDLKANRVKATVSGSGNINIAGDGVADDLAVNLSGSSNFKGINFESTDVMVKISGSGNADVFAVKNLNVRIAGSGNVIYQGNPLVDQGIVGSGTVKEY